MKDYEVKDRILEFMFKGHDAWFTSRQIAGIFNDEDGVDVHRVRALLVGMRAVGHVEWMNRHRPNINKITPNGIIFIRDKGGYIEWANKEAFRIAAVEVEREKEKRGKKWDRVRDWVFGGMILLLTVLQILQITGVI